MHRYPSCTGAPLARCQLQTSVTWPAVSETTGLSEALPTSEPASAQVSYTIASEHLPTFSYGEWPHVLSPLLWAQVRNTSGSTRTIYWRFELNGTSVATGNTSVSNNYYGILNITDYGTTFPVSGDTVGIKLWANGSGTSLLAHTMAMQISRLLVGTLGTNVLRHALMVAAAANLTGRPSYGSGAWSTNSSVFGVGASLWQASGSSLSGAITYGGTYGLFIPYFGDNVYSTNYLYAASSLSSCTVNAPYRLSSLRLMGLDGLQGAL